ncbi:MAG: TRAP transporter large permease [Lachnospiraceae bacterium]|nr:TRAP transporter large permease [Lachnospiraceae bacterium]
MMLVFGFVVLFALMLALGLPIFFSMGLASALPLAIGAGAFTLADFGAWSIAKTMNSTGVPIVLFIIAGQVMSNGKLTEKIYDIFNYFLGAKNGFMPIVCILTAMFYSSISGSATAVTAAVGGMCMPLLMEMGYNTAFCASILMCSGVLGFLIPPSTPLTVVIGLSDLDITTGYMGGAVLGMTVGIILILYAYIYCRIRGNGNHEVIMAHHMAVKSKGFVAVFKESIWALLSPVIILGGIFSGLFTVAQAAVVSVIYGAVVSVLIYRTLDWKRCMQTVMDGLKTAVPLLVVLFAANVLSTCLEALDAATVIANLIEQSGAGSMVVTLMILLALFLLGMFMDSGTACSLLVPIVLPVAVRLGIHPYQLLVAMVGIQSVGLVTPPVGLALFTMMPICKLSVGEITKTLWLPLVLFIAVCVIFALFPSLTPFLG